MTCHFIRHISFQIEIVSDKQKTAGGHRPSAVYYPKRFGFKPLNRFQKVSDRSERDETCTCGTCTCTSSSLRCSASSSMLSAFPRDLSVCFDVGIVAPFRPFVKHFFRVLSFFTKVLARTPIAPVHYSLLIINYHEEVCLEYHSQSDHRCCYRHRRGLRPASLPIVLASLPHPFPLPKEDNLPKRGHPLPRRTVFLKGPASPQRAGNGSPSGLSGRA